MATDADRGCAEIVLDPRAFHRGRARLQFQCFLIKFPRAFRIGNGDRDKCYFLDHAQIPFSFSGFNLWMMSLLPSGSCTTAM